MSTFVFVNTYAYSVTHVTNKLLLSLKEIIRESGLDVAKMPQQWSMLERGVTTWINSKHLETVTLEIFDSKTDDLVGRWDIEIVYGYVGDGSLWVDTDAIKYSIRKAGLVPAGCDYRIVVCRRPNAPAVMDGQTVRSVRQMGSTGTALAQRSVGVGWGLVLRIGGGSAERKRSISKIS